MVAIVYIVIILTPGRSGPSPVVYICPVMAVRYGNQLQYGT